MPFFNYTFGNSGEREINDVYYPDFFEISNFSYSFKITPKARFWRFGIRLYKSKDDAFDTTGSRHQNADFPVIHIGVGHPLKEWEWSDPNRFHLVQYHLPGYEHDFNRQETYIQFGEVIWDLKYNEEKSSLSAYCKAAGCNPFTQEIRIPNEYRYFKVFAWADRIAYTIECEFNIISYLSMTIGNVTFRLGDMFEPEPIQISDVILLPASTNGDATSNIYARASELGIPEPPPNTIGALITYQVPNADRVLRAGYCYSVKDDASSYEIISTLCENILNYLSTQSAKNVNLPLFGTGAGKLKPQIVARVYMNVFNRNPLSTNFIVSIINKEDFDRVKKGFESELTNIPEIKSRLHSDVHSLDESDVLNYDLIAENLFTILTDKATKPPLNVGVIAPWGRGKTNLMRRIQRRFDNSRKNLQPKNETKSTIISKESFFNSFKQFFGWLTSNLFTKTKKDETSFGTPTLDKIWSWLKMDKIGVQHNIPYPTVWFNPWNYQSCDMIWAGLANSIIEQVVSQIPSKIDQEIFWFQLQLARIDKDELRRDLQKRFVLWAAKFFIWLIVGITTVILFFVSIPALAFKFFGLGSVLGVITSIASSLKPYDAKISEAFDKYTKPPKYIDKLGTFHEVQTDVERVLHLCVDEEKPLIVFIDDLDRCSPSKVVEVIEAINVFINGNYNNKCYFVIGMDAEMVAAALDVAYENMKGKFGKKEYESGSVGWYFLDKFIQLPFFIPTMSEEKKKEYLRFLLSERVEKVNEPSAKIDEEKLSRVYANVMLAKDAESSAQEISEAELTMEEQLELDKRIMDNIVRSNSQDKNIIAQATLYAKFISSDPRSLKRFTNLLRFYSGYQFLRWKKNQRFVETNVLARWLAIMIKFPQFIRWLQADEDTKTENNMSIEMKAEMIDQLIDNYRVSNTSEQDNFNKWLELPLPEKFYQDNKKTTIKDLEGMPWLKTKSLFELLMNESSVESKFKNAFTCNVL